MFDVLMYLFETYIHTEAELRVDQDKLEQDLTDAGFDREDIYNALLWLEKLADYQEGLAEPMQLASDPLSMRIYTPEECERLDASCRGFLLFLEQIQVLNPEYLVTGTRPLPSVEQRTGGLACAVLPTNQRSRASATMAATVNPC